EALSVLDGKSQTATLVGSFAEAPVVRRYVEGGFGDTILSADDTALGDVPAAQQFADRLRDLVPGLPFVSFVNSGAEANEKALALCRQRARSDRQNRILAFEGSFHGRTLLSLHASYNPKKRAPFEIAGHEVTYAPYPVWWAPHEGEPAAPSDYLGTIARGRLEEAAATWGAVGDALLAEEIRSLRSVHDALSTGEYFALMVEPMQSEGGDRYSTARFHRALRLLTRHHGVSLIMDEVQCGFGLGGGFAWHHRFELIARDGNPDGPDCVCFAKRAQTGVVMSRFEDPEPTSAHGASCVRGLAHAEAMAVDTSAALEASVRVRLRNIAQRYPELVRHPRNTGYAVAFDLPSTAHMMAYLGQRFWRGAVVFGAGTKTVRYRLSTSYGDAELDLLFDTIRRSLAWLDAHPGKTPPKWEDLPPPSMGHRDQPDDREVPDIRYRLVSSQERDDTLAKVLLMEERVYEPARRDKPETLAKAFEDPDGVALVAEAKDGDEWVLVGSGLGAPLERFREVGGPDRDPMLGRDNSFYGIAITVDPSYRGFGVGKRLKVGMLAAAAEIKDTDGRARYRHATGRNRVAKTAAMMHVNASLGAYELFRVKGAYDDPEAEAIYYRMPVGPFAPDPVVVEAEARPYVDLAGGISRPFFEPPASLRRAADRGLLYGPTVNKITVMNYVTPSIVRAIEHIDALLPTLPHMYLTSSRDEAFDKAVRALRFHRPASQVVLGLDGGYVGHTTAAARSLSDPSVHRQGLGYFSGWGRTAHPAVVGAEAAIAALRETINEVGGPDKVIGFFVEPIQERTGRCIPDEYWPLLEALRGELDIPVGCVETPSACYRGGAGAFSMTAIDFVPNTLSWWAGGQVGFVHCDARYFVPTALTMVSTWDGDELSLVRAHHQLRAARAVDVGALAENWDRALAPARDAGLEVLGAGLYRVVHAGERTPAIVAALLARGQRVLAFPNGAFAIAPPLDAGGEVAEAFGEALQEALA
ncbi:MAG: aminotransferase class III-fold pyridoxal phosphate-dependent enzyme, partial [Deltaproteobacteria bacterium]|nr:aminotransferase class III-fold pyridoxal phosphate-dependent enzyme [Deltaproteobacteria bacterium]